MKMAKTKSVKKLELTFTSRGATNKAIYSDMDSARFVDSKHFKMDRIHRLEEILEKSAGLEDVLRNLIHSGSHLWKVRSPSKWFRRKYYLDLGAMIVKYETTVKNGCAPKGRRFIEIAEIHDVRSGWKTDTFNKVGASEDKKVATRGHQPTCEERNCFSIIHGSKMESLDLMAPNPEVADKWVRSLRYLISWNMAKEQERSYENWLRRTFASADLDKNKCLSFPETLKLLSELNINMNEDQARRLFNEANTTRSTGPNQVEVLDEDEFISFYFRLLQRPEIEKLFGSYASNGAISANQLCQFLQKEQGGCENVTIQECEAFIEIYEQSDLKLKGQMSSSGFVNLLLSPNFQLFNQSHKKIYHDMTQPLNHYFISTSHNTYLVGNQLSGDSSVEGYVCALRRGCRCVELDIWDGDDGEPMITHGFTLTTKILFKEVLDDAIKPYAFEKSDYPLILSFENHCSPPFQAKVAQYLREILGDMIYSDDVTEDMKELPSPEQLKNKIVIKAKKTKPKPEKSTSKFSREESKISTTTMTTTIISKKTLKDEVDSGETKNVEMKYFKRIDSNPPIASAESLQEDDSSSEEENDPRDDDVDFIDSTSSKKKRPFDAQVTSQELNTLINIMQGHHFRSFLDSKLNGKCYHICSFAESKTMKFIEQNGADLVDYNKHKMSRIYPGGARTGSSNFDPMQFWTAGCQLVALNYQTEDLPNFHNYAWFTENGSCGYLLKPEFLRNPDTRFNPTEIIKRPQVVLKLRIISAQHLPKIIDDPSDIVDPYVEIRVIGLEQDSTIKHQTHAVSNNGFNPIWDTSFEIRVRCPELAMLYLCIKDRCQTGTDEPLAYYAIPFRAISTGYRHIPLVDLKGTLLSPSTLFVHVKFN